MEEGQRRQQGKLIGGVEGRELVKIAEIWMREETIKDPERISAMLVPGIEK